MSTHEPLEESLNEFREGKSSTSLTSKQKLSFLKILRNNRPVFAIGEEPLGIITGHDIELYLYVERHYPPILRRPTYLASLETRKEIEKHINELLYMDVIRKIGHNRIVEITTPELITWHDAKSSLCGDLGALNNYTKAARYPIPIIPHSLDKLAKAKYITNMDCMKERRDAYERIKHELTNSTVLTLPDFELPFKLYIDTACGQGLGAALQQRQIVDGEPRKGVICYISRKPEDSEARYGSTQTECLCLVWALDKIHYYLEDAVFEVYIHYTALKALFDMKTTNRHMLRWKIAIQEYRGNMKIIYKEGKRHTNVDGLSIWPMDNVKRNPAYDPEVATKIPIHLMEIDRKKSFIFSECEPEGGTTDSKFTESEGTETPILRINSSELHN
ncbi:hypothetical protein O181_034552 [Austropuccinia psidii MF-1]|uniref:Reverse transcriptase RNase H-like domain-containing protein n=1 Tax=Austropuccinia psidii MF-1 TaxID=1389203 RepID=A0A9Q3D6U3_9BASI|nr:hypothetical protein [Austropuccinia psidii MF-1]